MLKNLFAVMAGGGCGSALRFLVSLGVSRLHAGAFPFGTFVVNTAGSFVIGLLMTLFVLEPGMSQAWRLFLVTGVLGGFTTFSSFEWETFALLDRGLPWSALLNVTASVLLGFAGVALGSLITNRLRGQ